jgi:hypothetical protein
VSSLTWNCASGAGSGCKDRTSAAKDPWLRNLPLKGFAQNQVYAKSSHWPASGARGTPPSRRDSPAAGDGHTLKINPAEHLWPLQQGHE